MTSLVASGRAAGALVAFACCLALASTGHAQQPAPTPSDSAERAAEDPEAVLRLVFDRLRFSGLGIAGGLVKPSQMLSTEAYALEADYGEIVPRWRVVFSTTFWTSQLNAATIRRYREQLGELVVDPSGDDAIEVGRVRVSDIALAVDTRWSPQRGRSAFLRPYVGAGIAAHVLNGEGRAIADTFVERALDNIAVAPVLVGGLDAVFFRKVSIGMQARYDLVNAARHGSVRALGTYHFDRPPAQGAGSGGR